jgi:hypothetical protein
VVAAVVAARAVQLGLTPLTIPAREDRDALHAVHAEIDEVVHAPAFFVEGRAKQRRCFVVAILHGLDKQHR